MGEPIATVGELAGICGHDGTNWEKILIDSSKRLVVAVASAVAQDAQVHGHISGAWQKQPLQFGYSGTTQESVINTNADAGTNNLDSTAVPSGEVHVITTIYSVNANTDPSYILISKDRSGTKYQMRRRSSPGVGESVEILGEVILESGDYIRSQVGGCTAGDNIRLFITGYKFDIDL